MIIIIILLRIYYYLEFILSRLIISKPENSILVMKLDAIGDMIIWLDSAQEIRRYYSDKKIVLICDNSCVSIVSQIDYFDEIIGIDKKKLFSIVYRLKFLNQISKRRFELLINPVFSRDYFFQDILVRLIKTPNKLGVKGGYLNNNNILAGLIRNKEQINRISEILKNKSDKYYSDLFSSSEEIIMEKTRNSEFIRHFINKNFKSNIPPIPFQLPNLNEILDLEYKSYIVLFVGASTKRKLWGRDRYIELLSSIGESKIVVCGGKGEDEIWNDVKNNSDIPNINNSINLIGKTSLIQLFSVIEGAKYIITNDTSASHITVLTRTPSVCLLGGVHFGRFQPYEIESISDYDKKFLPKVVFNRMDCFNCNLDCKYIKDKNSIWPCIESIKVEQVLEKIKEI